MEISLKLCKESGFKMDIKLLNFGQYYLLLLLIFTFFFPNDCTSTIIKTKVELNVNINERNVRKQKKKN